MCEKTRDGGRWRVVGSPCGPLILLECQKGCRRLLFCTPGRCSCQPSSLSSIAALMSHSKPPRTQRLQTSIVLAQEHLQVSDSGCTILGVASLLHVIWGLADCRLRLSWRNVALLPVSLSSFRQAGWHVLTMKDWQKW